MGPSQWSLPEHTIRISSRCPFWSPPLRLTPPSISADACRPPEALPLASGWWRLRSQWVADMVDALHRDARLQPADTDVLQHGFATLSLVVAIFVTGAGFYFINRKSAPPFSLIFSGIFMGLGIAAMHYIGMAAMREHVEIGYDFVFVGALLGAATG